jgi:hypothetical protein
MNKDKEMWILEPGMSGPSRVVVGRKAMIDKVSAIVDNQVCQNDPAWRGMLELDTKVGDRRYGYHIMPNGWVVRATRVLGPDDAGF